MQTPAPTSPLALSALLISLAAARSLPKGQQLHAHLLKYGHLPVSFPSSTAPLLSNHLITLYARCRLPSLSRRAFLDNPLRPPAAWSSLIASFAQNEDPHSSLLSFREMLRASVAPNDHTFPSATKSCAALDLPSLGRSVHSLAAKTGFYSDVFVASSLVDMYAKCGLLVDARRMFDEMPHKNVVSWSGLISGYAQMGCEGEAVALFKRALEAGLQPNDFTYSCVLRACGVLTLLEFGSQIHCRCVKSSYDSSPFVGSSLISLYSKCGLVDFSYKVFDEMPERNLGAWNAVLIASAQHGHTDTAFNRFREMEHSSSHPPNFITFLCLLTACSHAGLVEEGKRYFAMMSEQHGIQPGPQHYATIVDLLSRAGKLKEAMDVISQMPIPPTESVWGALLTGCRLHNDTETAAFAAEKLFETGSTSSGAHMLLTNAYAAAGRYAEAARARKAMRDKGVRKETGLSWLETTGGAVHTFVSGDRSHARSEEIYEALKMVGEKMEKAGYVADTSSVLRDVDGEEKKSSVWYHSERLAIGFGLLTVPEGRPIRVMKNLRVCGDCHTAIKYVSKVTGRVVILRDNNRFHRFEDGVCSCGDYW
nr:pentatricopeptide repeat protein AaPPR1421 [Agave angustifolia]